MYRYALPNALLELDRGDIARERVDAIANAANSFLSGGGGVDGAIRQAAGPELDAALEAVRARLPGAFLDTGGAVITPGFRLKAAHIIHCVGPVFAREADRAPALLASCYDEALRLCRAYGLQSVAFPSISTGVYGYPVGDAAEVAVRAVHRSLTLESGPALVRFVLFDGETLEAYHSAAAGLRLRARD